MIPRDLLYSESKGPKHGMEIEFQIISTKNRANLENGL